jgi:hypothetical protein
MKLLLELATGAKVSQEKYTQIGGSKLVERSVIKGFELR